MNWTIAQLDYNNDSDKGVVTAHWRLSKSETVTTDGVDVDHHGSSYGTSSWTPDPSADSYQSYDSLTEDAVLAWVHSDVDKDAIEASVQAQIDDSKTPAMMHGTPWA